jgi:stage V sporulation protein B
VRSKQTAFIYLTVASLFYLIASYGANLWLGRHLGPHNFGVYSIVISIVTILNLIQTSGIPQSAGRLIAKEPQHSKEILSNALTLQLISAIILSLVVVIFAHPLAILLKDSSLENLIRLSAIIFPAYGIYSLYYGYFNGMHYFKQQALINISYSFGKAIGIIGLSYFYGLKGSIIGFALSSVPALIFIKNQIPKLTFNYRGQEILKYSMPLIGSAAGLTLFLTLDLLFIKGILKNSTLAGFYSASQNIAIIPFLSLSAFSSIVFPSLSKKIHDGDIEGLKSTIEDFLRTLLILTIPITALIIGTNNQLVSLFYGHTYSPAAPSLAWLACVYAILTVFAFLVSVLNAAGHAQYSWIYAGVGIFLAVLLYLTLISHRQLVGAAIGTGIGVLFATTLAFRSIHGFFKVNLPIKTILRAIASSFVLIIITHFIRISGLFLIPWYVLLMVFYVVLLLLTREVSGKEIRKLQKVLPLELFKIKRA